MNSQLNEGWIYRNRIGQQDAGQSILQFYQTKYHHSTAEQWVERGKTGKIFLNSKKASVYKILQAEDILEYHRPPWREAGVPTNYKILYRDKYIIAVDKPAGLPVMAAGNFLTHTLHYLLKNELDEALTPLHRLGRGTSGIVLFARTKTAEKYFFRNMQLRKIKKLYRALVCGIPARKEFQIKQKIGKIAYPLIGYIHVAAQNGRNSQSDCRILSSCVSQNQSIIEINLVTGRPHQIRIHLAWAGHPLVGDPLYVAGGVPGESAKKNPPILPGAGGYHLHAGEISFCHPQSNNQITIKSDYPEILSGYYF